MKINTVAIALALCLGTPLAHASIIQIGDNADANYDCDVAIGDNANAAGGTGADLTYYCAVAVGQGANASSQGTAVGNQSSAANASVALGSFAVAQDWYTTAVGASSYAATQNASAFGSSAIAGGYNSTSVGASSTAYGYEASTFGAGAAADYTNSVALGANTATTRENEVAVGNRQIGQVADGTEDTDAINLRQLNAALAGLGGGESPYFKANGLNDGTDNAFANGTRSVAAGSDASANGVNDVAVGPGAYANGEALATDPNCVAPDGLPLGSATAIGPYASAQGCGTLAQGSGAIAQGPNATATGSISRATGNAATAYGLGATAEGDYTTAVGPGALAQGRAASAYGNNAQAQGNAATSIGAASWAAPTSTALGVGAGASNSNAIALGFNTRTTRDNEVAIGGRLLGQVADGVMDTDAVTVRQLSQVAAFFGGGASFNGGVWTPPSFALSGGTFNDVNTALLYLDGRIGTGSGEPGPQGPRGADGRSAYEIAVEEGFVGTQQEWIDSLQGADGQEGAPGRDGVGGSKVKGGSNIAVTDNDDGTQTVSVADNIKLSDQGSVEVGATRVDANGVTIQGGPSMTRNGVDAGGKRITNVAPGRIASDSWDAVNGSQLWELNDRWENRIGDMDKRISGVCAMGAAQAQAIGAAAANSARRKVSAGIGYCGGQAAMSANMSWDATTPSGSIASFSIGVSSTGDDTSIGGGVSFGW